MAGKGGDHPFAVGFVYVIGAVIAVFLIGRLTHTDVLGFAKNGSDTLSRFLGGGSASESDLKTLKVAEPAKRGAGVKVGHGSAFLRDERARPSGVG